MANLHHYIHYKLLRSSKEGSKGGRKEGRKSGWRDGSYTFSLIRQMWSHNIYYVEDAESV